MCEIQFVETNFVHVFFSIVIWSPLLTRKMTKTGRSTEPAASITLKPTTMAFCIECLEALLQRSTPSLFARARIWLFCRLEATALTTLNTPATIVLYCVKVVDDLFDRHHVKLGAMRVDQASQVWRHGVGLSLDNCKSFFTLSFLTSKGIFWLPPARTSRYMGGQPLSFQSYRRFTRGSWLLKPWASPGWGRTLFLNPHQAWNTRVGIKNEELQQNWAQYWGLDSRSEYCSLWWGHHRLENF